MKQLIVLCLLVLATSASCAVDPRGPIVTPAFHAAIVPGGVATEPFAFDPAASAMPTPWHAQWIRANAPETNDASVSLLRKDVTLPQTPSRVTAWFTGDACFRLYINGKVAARGPVDNGRDYVGTSGHWFYEARDFSSYFRQGRNVIAVELFRTPFVGSSWHTGHTGFLFEARAVMPKETLTIASDTTWRATAGPQWQILQNPSVKGISSFDATKEPAQWRDRDFDDTAWKPCINAGAWWPVPLPSEIPPVVETLYPPMAIEHPSAGVKIPRGKLFADGPVVVPGDGSFTVRFDRVLSAYPGLKIHGKAGTTILVEDHELDSPGHRRGVSIALRDGETTVEFPFLDSFTVLNITVKNAKGATTFDDVDAVFASQPVPYRGEFACSDRQLTDLWQAERWATQICMQTHHLDSPNHQEPLMDCGDYLIEARVNYSTFNEPWLARQDLRKFAWELERCHYQTFHTSYSLLWLQMLMEYADRTGDTALVKELAPDVFALLDQFASYRGDNGLLSNAPNYMFMDWVTIAGFPCHHPPAVIGQGYMTAFYYRALADGMRVAELTGNPARAAAYQQLRSDVRAAFERELWNPDKGLYRDGKPHQNPRPPSKWFPADTDIETFSTQLNALAVLYDLAPAERRAPLMKRLLARDDLNCQPYFMHFVFDALAHAGPSVYEQFATAQLRRWQINPVTHTAQEMWGKGDWSHGWVATPVIQMSERILGVVGRPDGIIQIQPLLCDLQWAKGKVPAGEGDVEVSWKRSGADVHVEVVIPPGRRAMISLPGESSQQVAVGEGKSAVDFHLSPR